MMQTVRSPVIETPPAGAQTPLAEAPGERQRLSLRANFSWTFLGNVVYAGCQWAMLVLLAKLGSPERVGYFALALAITAPVIMFTNLQLRSVQATDARREFRFNDYFGLRIASTAVALLAIAGIVIASRYAREAALVVLTVAVAKGFEAISDVFYGLFQQHERMDRIALSMVGKGVLSLLALGGVLALTNSLLAAVVALAITWGLVLAAYDIPNGAALLAGDPLTAPRPATHLLRRASLIRPRWSFPTLGRLAWLALPLGAGMLLSSLSANIPRYFIAHNLDARNLGIFAALSYLMITGNMVIGALGQSASPRLARFYAAGDIAAFRALLLRLIAIGALLGGGGVLAAALFGRRILLLLYRPEYAAHTNVFFWLMVADGIYCVASFPAFATTAARYFRVQTPLWAVIALATALACKALVPVYGLLGAAFAVVIGMLLMLVGSVAFVFHAMYRGTRGERV
jgi:O-antigen/teichoic acid export membrane protein